MLYWGEFLILGVGASFKACNLKHIKWQFGVLVVHQIGLEHFKSYFYSVP